jgi:flavin reductase (DIM6/NTAB) family NADH-FMN oxidoreductase RutF
MGIKAKEQTLRMLPYGLYVLVARSDEGTNAATVRWLSQSPLKPPRIVVALGSDTGIWHEVRQSGTFAVNVLGSGQKHLASAFFRRVEPEGNVLGNAAFHDGVTGASILDQVPAYLECRISEMLDAGDHTLFLADVVEVGVQSDLPALGLDETGWHYGG